MPKAETVHRLCVLIAQADLPEPELEYLFAPVVDGKPIRRWRFDLAWPDRLIALEIEGGFFRRGGRHGGQPSAIEDLEKRNAAAALGWRVLITDTSRAVDGRIMPWLRHVLADGPLPY